MVQTKGILAKLFKLQKEIGAIKKESENPFFKSKYFDINKLIEILKPIFNEHGLVLIQPLTSVDGKAALKTSIIDCDTGEEMTESVVLPEDINPQKMGSIITYYRRYALQSLLFLQAEDDDGETAANRGFEENNNINNPSPF